MRFMLATIWRTTEKYCESDNLRLSEAAAINIASNY